MADKRARKARAVVNEAEKHELRRKIHEKTIMLVEERKVGAERGGSARVALALRASLLMLTVFLLLSRSESA